MSLVVITPPDPDAPIPSLEEVKAHLRSDFTDDDEDILSKIWGAITEFEDPSFGILGRSFIQRELELRLDEFSDPICLQQGPLLEGENIEIAYDDADGVEQIVSDTVYRVLDPESAESRVVLRTGQAWPTTSGEEQCVRVRYWVGYLDDDVRISNFKSAVKLHVEMTYDGNTEEKNKVSETIYRLLAPYRTVSL